MSQLEFYKSIQFVIELLIAEGIFSLHLTLRSKFYLRLPLGLAAVFLFSYFFPLASSNAFYISFMFLAIFAVTLLVGKFLFRESWVKLLFCFIAGYTVQHIAYEFYNISLNLMGLGSGTSGGLYGNQNFQMFPNAFVAIVYFFIYIATYFFSAYLFSDKIERGEDFQLKSYTLLFLVGLILVVDIVLNAVVVFYLPSDTGGLYFIIVGIYNLICCFITIFLQFEVSLRKKLEDTLQTVQLLRHKEEEQYEAAKENIELINMKCHDLRHQIRTIGTRSAIGEESVKEIESIISIYDSAIQTGNVALDVILTEKRLYCSKNGIKLSCIADGNRLSFMKENDIYSLFGNLVDNAIEAVRFLPEEKRVIGLRVRSVETLLTINIHNFYEHDLTFKDDMPQTTKEEKAFHGFGLKSVRYLCEKYGGDFSIKAEGGVFNINILFSLTNESE